MNVMIHKSYKSSDRLLRRSSQSLLLLLLATTCAQADQLAPNPNPASTTLTIGAADIKDNSGLYDNNGTIENYGSFTNNSWAAFNNNAGSAFNNYNVYFNQTKSSTRIYTGATFTNTATGTLTNYYGPGEWGKIEINGGTLDNYGAITTDGYENFNIFTGAGIMNYGGTLNNHATGVMGGDQPNYNLNTGVSLWNGGTLNNAGTMYAGAVTNYHAFNNQTGGVLNIGGMSVDPVYAHVENVDGGFPYNAVIANDGTINIGNGGSLDNSEVLQNNLGGEINIKAGGSLQNNFIVTNHGTINNTGGTLYNSSGISGNGSYVQTGATALAIINGSGMSQDVIDIQEGTLSGYGTLSATSGVTIGPNATVSPGSSPGTLSIGGDLSLEGTYLAEIEGADISGFGYHDLLSVSGSVNLGTASLFHAVFGPGYTPMLGDIFNVLAADEIYGDFSDYLITFLPPYSEESSLATPFAASYPPITYGFSLDILHDADGGTLDYLQLSVISASAVPLPMSAWLLGSGLLSLIAIQRRKPGRPG